MPSHVRPNPAAGVVRGCLCRYISMDIISTRNHASQIMLPKPIPSLQLPIQLSNSRFLESTCSNGPAEEQAQSRANEHSVHAASWSTACSNWHSARVYGLARPHQLRIVIRGGLKRVRDRQMLLCSCRNVVPGVDEFAREHGGDS